MSLSPFLLYPVLFAAGLVAGWIDSIAGGGGLVTIPAMLALGFPPQTVLGTNKFQASFGSLTAAAYYVHKDVVPMEDVWPGVGWTLVGAAGGAWAVQQIPGGILGAIIPFLLLGVALYMIFSPPLGDRGSKPRLARQPFYILFGIGLGFYDGFFGPGVGSFWAIAFVLLLDFPLVKATGYTKVMNFTSNVVSLLVFLLGGQVLFAAGSAMAAGQVLGARMGSRLVVQRGARFIRPVFLVVVILTTLKLLYDRLV